MAPAHEDSWFEIFGRVAITRRPERFENRAAALNRFYEVYAFAVGAPGEHKVGILFNEISKRKEAEAHLKLMVNELNHRVKNTLAVVQAIAQQTFKHDEVAKGARRRFEGRLASLAAAHNLLTRSHWEKASLQEVVQAVVGSCSAAIERVTIRGPAVNLSAAEAVSLSMALHELCINAIKYGALSNEPGRIDIVWQLNSDASRRLQLTWTEQDGPTVAMPTRRGFGSTMVEGALAYELSGKAKLDYLPAGVVCTIEAPLSLPQVIVPSASCAARPSWSSRTSS
jgi:two-component system CheB/CheR fusion protein